MRKAKRAKPPGQFAEAKKALERAIYGDGGGATLGGIDKIVATHDAGTNEWTVNRAPSATDNLDVKAHNLIALGRKKGGEKAVTDELMQLFLAGRYEGQQSADREHMQQIKEIRRAQRDKAIAGFLAMTSAGGADVLMLGAITVDAIVDALTEAGYTAKGRR